MALISGSGDETAKVAGATGIQFPKLTTTERNALSSVGEGTIIYNDTDNELQVYNNDNEWVAVNFTPMTATGGTISNARSGYTAHIFTSPGTFTVTAGDTTNGEVLVVAGGGSGGGGRHCGGGGAGAIRFSNNTSLSLAPTQ